MHKKSQTIENQTAANQPAIRTKPHQTTPIHSNVLDTKSVSVISLAYLAIHVELHHVQEGRDEAAFSHGRRTVLHTHHRRD